MSGDQYVGVGRPPGARTSGDTPLTRDARRLLATLNRAERKAEEQREIASAAREDLARIHRKTEERFGIEVPQDALVLDVLDSIEVADGDRWLWRGVRNNKNLPTVRVEGMENSLTRMLAVAFGVIRDDQWGALYPTNGDTEDVNPFHRVLRESPKPTGNPSRYGFSATERAL